ncbi:Suf-domain-containing protein [Wallemia mellicola]|nr:Suf-domain-containing protein [Wallemia mellicola]
MEENVYNSDTQQAISEQLESLTQGLANDDAAQEEQQEEHYQPPFLRDEHSEDPNETYKDAQQTLEDVAQSDDQQVVAAPNLPNISITPTPTPPIPAAVNTDVKSSQLPPLPVPKDRKESLEMQIQKDERDVDSWLDLISYLDSQGRNLVGDELESWWTEYTRVYDNFFKIWPCAVKQWQNYIDKCLSLTPPRMKKVEEIFSKALKQTPSPEFWSSYLNYIRRNNQGAEGRQIVIKAYEFAISHVGQDKDSGEIWLGYIRFLKDGSATNTWEEQQRMDALRRTYQRAVVIPIQNLEAIWREWDSFEGSLNKVTAKKFLADKSPAYMTARSALREIRSLTDPPISLFHIDGTLAKVPSWTERERQVISAWKRYLAWEEGNPLELDDNSAKHSRVSYAYKKALVYMRFYPEFWYRAYMSHKSMGKDEEAISLLKQGSEANPESYLLSFALAEVEEINHRYKEAHDILNNLLTSIIKQTKEIENGILRQQAELNNQLPSIEQQANASQAAGENEGEVREKRRLAEDEINTKKEAISKAKAKDIEDLCKGAGLVWVMKMRLGRRTEGIKAARAVFKEARSSPYCTWQVFEAGAMMEYHSSKDSSVATKIFELGLKRFTTEIDYVIKYLDFLININDEGNARALFERIAPSLPADKARPLWTRWASYEYFYSDLPSALKLEQRLADTFPDEQPLRRFAERHTHQRIDKIATNDLGYGVKPPTAPMKIVEATAASAATKRPPVDLEEERNKRMRKDPPSGRNSRQTSQQGLPQPPHRNTPVPNVQIGGAPIHLGGGRPAPVAMMPPRPAAKDPVGIFLQQLPQARMPSSKPITLALELLPNLLSLNVPLDKKKCSELLNYRHSILHPRRIEEYLCWNPNKEIINLLEEINSDEALDRTPKGFKYEEDGQYVKFSLNDTLYIVLKEEGENDWKYHDLEIIDNNTLIRNGQGGWYVSQDVALDAFILKAEQLIREANDKTKVTENEQENNANQDFWADFSDDSDLEGVNPARLSLQPPTSQALQQQEDAFFERQATEHMNSLDNGADKQISVVDSSTKAAIKGVYELYKQGKRAECKEGDIDNKTTDEESFLELVLQSLNA